MNDLLLAPKNNTSRTLHDCTRPKLKVLFKVLKDLSAEKSRSANHSAHDSKAVGTKFSHFASFSALSREG